MTLDQRQPMTDPLAVYMKERIRGRAPIPLVSTAIEVEVHAGLVIVSMTRVFRNDEAQSIEPVMTFPVPVRATLFALEAKVGGRRLTARAARRDQARETYEDALSQGRLSVLQEEVLRGVHMLSVAPVAPGETVEILARWVAPLAHAEGVWRHRIPLTVGDVYGGSPLANSDDLLIGGPVRMAALSVRCDDGVVSLGEGALVGGCAQVPLNRPVDLHIRLGAMRPLLGVAADGTVLELRAGPRGSADAMLDMAVLVDRSGSMDWSDGASGGRTKHQMVVAALAGLAPRLRSGDAVDLWQFDNDAEPVGRLCGRACDPTRRAARRHRTGRRDRDGPRQLACA